MIEYTLVADGPSDRALLPILDWLISEHCSATFAGTFAEFLPPPRVGLTARLKRALELYPASIYFVHRDAEALPFNDRKMEILKNVPDGLEPYVALVPVRMTEAWLLSDEVAIRAAADNPNGTMPLGLPKPKQWEHIADAKRVLRQALTTASGLSGRRRSKFDPDSRRIRVAQITTDFEALRLLPAFMALEVDLSEALEELGLCA